MKFIVRATVLAALVTAGFSLFAPGCTEKPDGPIFKVSDRSYRTLNAALLEAIDSQVFFVGEHHDNPHHHSNQLEIIREVHEAAERPLAIGLEMFETGYQKQLDQWVSGDLPLDNFIKAYYDNWDQPWILYRDIFLYAREHRIPLLGLNIPRQVVRKVALNGFASLDAGDLALLPGGVTCDVTPEYETFMHRVFGWHGEKNDSFANFCEAQILWDTVMAVNLLEYNRENPAVKLVVLAGDGHSWKPGIPRQMALRSDSLPMAVFLPETNKLHRRNVSLKDADYLWLLNFL